MKQVLHVIALMSQHIQLPQVVAILNKTAYERRENGHGYGERIPVERPPVLRFLKEGCKGHARCGIDIPEQKGKAGGFPGEHEEAGHHGEYIGWFNKYSGPACAHLHEKGQYQNHKRLDTELFQKSRQNKCQSGKMQDIAYKKAFQYREQGVVFHIQHPGDQQEEGQLEEVEHNSANQQADAPVDEFPGGVVPRAYHSDSHGKHEHRSCHGAAHEFDQVVQKICGRISKPAVIRHAFINVNAHHENNCQCFCHVHFKVSCRCSFFCVRTHALQLFDIFIFPYSPIYYGMGVGRDCAEKQTVSAMKSILPLYTAKDRGFLPDFPAVFAAGDSMIHGMLSAEPEVILPSATEYHQQCFA